MSLLFNGKNTKNTLKESATFYLLGIANLKPDLLTSRLFSEPTSREFLLIGAADKDTAFTVLRASASMKPDAASAGNLSNDGKESLKLRRLRHAYSVYQRRNEIVCILKRVADRNQCLLKSLFSHFVQSPSHGSPIRRHSDQFVICLIKYNV